MVATIAIDPGASGAAALFEGPDLIEVHTFESIADSANYVASLELRYDHIDAIIEQVGGYIGKPQAGSAMFRFGENYGAWQGILSAYKVPYIRVTPQRWQKPLDGLTKLKGPDRKRRLKAIATERYPNAKPTLKTADAILIGDYYWRSK